MKPLWVAILLVGSIAGIGHSRPATEQPLLFVADADERSGIFYGSAKLDAAHLKLLLSNRTYVDIDTVKHGPGEVRDQWRPLDPTAAAKLRSVIEARPPSDRSRMASGSCHGP
jgi:hypothetical protein